MRSNRRRNACLLAACAGLAGLVAVQLIAGPFFVPDPPQEVPSILVLADTPVTPPAKRPDISDFAEVTARPLFSSSRRPYEPSEEPKVEAVANTQSFDLIGVTISAAERSALLRPKTSNQAVVRVVEGQAVGGWEVRAIAPTQVTLARASNAKDSTVLTINEKRKKYVGSTPAISQKQITPDQASQEEPQQDSASTGGTAGKPEQ